jgi:hypothetical protein
MSPPRETTEPSARDRLDDVSVQTLLEVGLGLQEVLPVLDGAARGQVQAAIGQLDGLIRTIRDAAYAGSVHSAGRTLSCPPMPVTAPVELRQVLATAALLYQRAQRVTVALALSQDVTANLFDRLDHDRPGGPGSSTTRAGEARALASACREFASELHSLGPPAAVPAEGGNGLAHRLPGPTNGRIR